MKNLVCFSVTRHRECGHDSRCSLVAVVVSTTALDLPNQLRLNPATAYALHHREVLEVVMRLKESITGEELDEDAANAPNIARITPS